MISRLRDSTIANSISSTYCVRLFALFIVLMPLQIPLTSGNASAQTQIGGIISSSVTWSKASSPYSISSNVQIASSAIVTIEPGATVSGNGKEIQIYGTLNAIGTSTSRIVLSNLTIKGSSLVLQPSNATLAFCEISNCSISPGTSDYFVSFSLRDSKIQNSPEMFFIGSPGTVNIERNIFIASGGIGTWAQNGFIINIWNNVFYLQTGPIWNWVNSSVVNVQRNSFLSTDRIAVKLPAGLNSASLSAVNNHWNTPDVSKIKSMIFDKNNDLAVASYISYVPFLLTPDASTPSFPLLSSNATTLSFGSVRVDSAKVLSLMLRNEGIGVLKVSSITSSNASYSVLPFTSTIGSGDSINIGVKFIPTKIGSTSGTLNILHDGGNTAPTITVSGTGTAASISINPVSLDFGKVRVGVPSVKTLQVLNVGNLPMRLDSIVSSINVFSVATFNSNISPGLSSIINVSYKPVMARSDTAVLGIYHDAPGSMSSVLLSGTGVIPNLVLLAKTVAFGKLGYKPWIDTVAGISNTGTDTLRVSNAYFDNSSFSARPSDFYVAPNQIFYDTLRFSPVSIGIYTGRMILVSDSPTSPDTIMTTGSREVLSSTERRSELPQEFALDQNYPNPFNPSTTISYQVPTQTRVTLKIFNILGQELEVLIDAEHSAGTYKIHWNPELASGVYIYRLQGENYTDVKKLVLIR